MIWYLIKTWKEFLTNRKIVMTACTLLVLLMLFVFGVQEREEQTNNTSKFALGVVDNDKSIYSNLIVQYFQNTDSFDKFAKIHIGEEENIKAMFDEGSLLAYFVIPEGFANNLIHIKNTPIKVTINTTNPTMSMMFQNVLESYEQYISSVQINAIALYDILDTAGVSDPLLDKYNIDTSVDLVALALNREAMFVKNEVSEILHTPLHKYYVWAVLSVLLTFTSLISGALFLKERELGTYARLRIIGHSVVSVVGAILLSNILIWSLLVCIVMYFVMQVLSLTMSFEFYIFLCCTVVLANFISLFIASICSDKKAFLVLGNMICMLMAMVGGVAVPITFLPEKFLRFSRLTPNYWVIKNAIAYSNGQTVIAKEVLIGVTIVVAIVLFYMICIRIRHTKKYNVGGDYETL